MTTTTKSGYKVCPKCKVRHSTLTKHKCFKTEKQKEAPKAEPVEHDLEDGGETESLGHDGENTDDPKGKDDAESEGETPNEGEGDGDEKADGKADGEGEGEAEGEADGEGDGDGEGEGPVPQPPEPEAPPVAVVCSVLKFAALTARAAKGGVVSVELTEDGLLVYGHNGDLTAHAVMPWGEFEKRSTIDGQFYVKEVIDGVDAKIDEDKLSYLERAMAASEAHKAKKARGADDTVATKSQTEAAVILTLPLTLGQLVVLRTGTVAKVADDCGRDIVDLHDMSGKYLHCVWTAHGTIHKPKSADGLGIEDDRDVVADAVLTLPLTVGQAVLLRDGRTVKITKIDGDDDEGVMTDDSCWYTPMGKYVRASYGHDHESDMVADAVAKPDAVVKPKVKAKLTLPLVVGRSYVRKNGDTVTVESMEKRDGMDVAYTNTGSRVWADTGSAKGEGRHNFGAADRVDIVRDA